jgi:quercetin dioxygenase-like cupin family protein
MDTLNLTTLVDEELATARSSRSGRTARTIHGGRQHTLRQTVIALTAGSALADHHGPGEATLQVLHGRVRLTTATASQEASAGDLLMIPDERHGLVAIDDSAVLLTTAVNRA